MKAKIINGELEGVEFELSQETINNIKESQVPTRIRVGQIYKIGGNKYMVASLGTIINKAGLTIVDGYSSGCYSPSVVIGEKTYDHLRQILINKNAKYLGEFNDVFQTKEN